MFCKLFVLQLTHQVCQEQNNVLLLLTIILITDSDLFEV